MTTHTRHHCNACGAEIPAGVAAVYSGIHLNNAATANDGTHEWHSCNATCAAAHLRAMASRIEAHGARIDAMQAEVDENRAAFAAATQALRT